MKKETDLTTMSVLGNCKAQFYGTPTNGWPEADSICLYSKNSNGSLFYFAENGSINITTLESNGNLAATLSGDIRLVEINTEDGLPVSGGKCIEITNETLSYTAQ